MSILCRCPSCEAKFKVEDQYAGRKAKCPRCGQVTVIPTASDVSDSSITTTGSSVAASPSGVRSAPPRKPPQVAPAPATLPVSAIPPAPAKPPVAAKPPVSKTPPQSATPPVGRPPMPAATQLAPVAPASPQPAMGLAPAVGAPAGERRSHARRGKKHAHGPSSNIWLIIGGIAAAALLALGGGVFAVMSLLGGGDTPGVLQAKLVLDWPSEERGEAVVLIDGKKHNLAGAGELAYSLPAGDHRVRLQRRGYEPIEVAVSLKPGDVHHYVPEWKQPSFAPATGGLAADVSEPVPPGFEGWTQRYDAALQRAAREKKSVLVALVGSDWNGDTRRLASAVFPDAHFHERAAEDLVLVVIDWPESKQAYEQLLDSAQNEMLFQEYSVSPEDVPTIVMLDSRGKPFAIEHNYEASSAAELLADLDQWETERAERDRLITYIDGVAGEERAKAAVAAVDWLAERGLTRFYGDHFRQWEQIALQLDPANAAGYYEALFEANWLVRWYTAGRNEDAAQIERIVSEFDAWRQRFTFHDADRAARMHLIAAASLVRLGREDDAVQHIDAGLGHKPTDEQLLAQLQTLSRRFSGELASGTGFVVGRGYVLTNHHVIEGEGRVVVMSPGSKEETPAQVIAMDPTNDIALLRVTGAAEEFPPLTLSNVEVNRGARVAAFGYPLGDVLGRGLKLTTGVVSALPEGDGDNMYLLDCRVNPGNSGGPLCNQRGQVIGMVTAKSGSSEEVDSYGMALPADLLQDFLQKAVPGWTPPAAAEPPASMEWDEVDAAVSASVLTVVKKR